jgi:hypothetical protein
MSDGLPYLNLHDLRWLLTCYSERKKGQTASSGAAWFEQERDRIRNAIQQLKDANAVCLSQGEPETDIYFMPRPKDYELLWRHIRKAQ